MIKDVLINVRGESSNQGESDIIELTTEGRFGIKEGQYFLTYNEGELLEEKVQVKTSIHIKNCDSLVLQRSGTVNSRMVIKKGERNTCFYSTTFGDLVIGIFGESLSFNLNEKGGNIDLVYTIDTNMQLISRNRVNITIREVN